MPPPTTRKTNPIKPNANRSEAQIPTGELPWNPQTGDPKRTHTLQNSAKTILYVAMYNYNDARYGNSYQ
jgi:hypothetical protein